MWKSLISAKELKLRGHEKAIKILCRGVIWGSLSFNKMCLVACVRQNEGKRNQNQGNEILHYYNSLGLKGQGLNWDTSNANGERKGTIWETL